LNIHSDRPEVTELLARYNAQKMGYEGAQPTLKRCRLKLLKTRFLDLFKILTAAERQASSNELELERAWFNDQEIALGLQQGGAVAPVVRTAVELPAVRTAENMQEALRAVVRAANPAYAEPMARPERKNNVKVAALVASQILLFGGGVFLTVGGAGLIGNAIVKAAKGKNLVKFVQAAQALQKMKVIKPLKLRGKALATAKALHYVKVASAVGRGVGATMPFAACYQMYRDRRIGEAERMADDYTAGR
jgi:hypothetical protein